jgi:hypothetical protein
MLRLTRSKSCIVEDVGRAKVVMDAEVEAEVRDAVAWRWLPCA